MPCVPLLRSVAVARRERATRTARIARLFVRQAVGYVGTRVRGVGSGPPERAEIDERFAIRSAEEVTAQLGQMKGAAMKAGQMLSYLGEGLPPAAQQALASLQAHAPPMAPGLARQVVRDELGRDPEELFAVWEPDPVAAASIGQVHRAVAVDGRELAVKVQYPGVDRAIGADLANADGLLRLFSMFALKSVDTKALVEELRLRMAEELDYRIEAEHQMLFASRYENHPFIHVPAVVPEFSTMRVLTSEWVDGMGLDEFVEEADEPTRQKAAEAVFRFAQASVYEHLVFNGDPHPGNYLFHPDGTVTILDFGLVKRWSDEDLATLFPLIGPVLANDGPAAVAEMTRAGFLRPDHGLDPDAVWAYVRAPYRPYHSERFRFTREWVRETLGSVFDVYGPHRTVIDQLEMPASFVLVDRLVWGMASLLGRLGAENCWNAILAEYREGAPPATKLGEVEARWRSMA